MVKEFKKGVSTEEIMSENKYALYYMYIRLYSMLLLNNLTDM